MVRPIKKRIVSGKPETDYFKPRGIPMMDLEEVRLTVDELEALRLTDLSEMSYEEAGKRMGVSRATFGRIVQQARKSLADAIINGKAIRIEGGTYAVKTERRIFRCIQCVHTWEEPPGTGPPIACPECRNETLFRVSESNI